MKITTLSLTVLIFFVACTATATEPNNNVTTSAPTESQSTQTTIPQSTLQVVETKIPPPPTLPPEPTKEPIGTLNLEESQVEHGADINSLNQILDKVSLFANDAIRVSDGGEALLDFGDKMYMRLFNDTEMEVISAEIGQDVPLGVRFFLYRGGFTGQLTEEGSHVVYETPGGVEITILGTTYFVVYDEIKAETIVGNFEGNVSIKTSNEMTTLEDGFLVIIPDNQPPENPQPLLISFADFEDKMRVDKSPAMTANLMSTWLLDIFLEWDVGGADDPDFQQFVWTGAFEIDEEEIIGEGIGTIQIHVVCPSAPTSYYEIEGSFDFDISGQLIGDGSENPQLDIAVRNENLELIDTIDESTSDPDYCRNDWHEPTIAEPIRILLDTFSHDTNDILIDMKDGASLVIEIPDDKAMYIYNSGTDSYVPHFYAQKPISVTISAASLADSDNSE